MSTAPPLLLERSLGLALVGDPDLSRLTFAEWGGRWLASRRHLKASTQESYGLQLKQVNTLIGDVPVGALSADDMAGLVIRMQRAGFAPGTIRNRYATATSVLDHAVRHGALQSNPARLVSRSERAHGPSRRAHPLAASEITALLDAGREPWRAMFGLGIFAGLRSGEICGLKWLDVDLANRRLHVRRQAQLGELVSPKTENSRRVIVLLDPLLTMLENYRSRSCTSSPDGLLFSDEAGKPILVRRLHRMFRRTVVRAGIVEHEEEPTLRVHDLRHTFASLLIAAHADVAFVAHQLGHSSPTTTLSIYASLFDEAENVDRVSAYVTAKFPDFVG